MEFTEKNGMTILKMSVISLINYLIFVKYYLRYLDDVLILFDLSVLTLGAIGNLLIQMFPELRFVLEFQGDIVKFLDTKI